MNYDLGMKQKELEERLKSFAINIVKLVNSLPKSQSNLIYGKQIIRSSSSIGANYAEAVYAHTKFDFIHSLNISRKEANETLYWLSLLKETNNTSITTENIVGECEEILKIFISSVKTTKENMENGKSSIINHK